MLYEREIRMNITIWGLEFNTTCVELENNLFVLQGDFELTYDNDEDEYEKFGMSEERELFKQVPENLEHEYKILADEVVYRVFIPLTHDQNGKLINSKAQPNKEKE
jgi:hypothetical protein